MRATAADTFGFEALALTREESARIEPALAAAGRLLGHRPGALGLLVRFETWDDGAGAVRAAAGWSVLDRDRRPAAPEAAFPERRAWADCWAVARVPWAPLAGGLLARGGLAPRAPGRLLGALERRALLLWPEAALLLDDALPLDLRSPLPEGTLRPLVGERFRTAWTSCADLLRRLEGVFPGLAGAG